MKPNELRMGNLVKIRDTGEIVRVCGLLPKSVQYKKDLGGESDYRYCGYVDIEGVLIFDHWQKIDRHDLYWYDNYDDEKWYGYCNCDRAIRYIHELQNIHYALTGEELNIEL